jgi:hypothetical protein
LNTFFSTQQKEEMEIRNSKNIRENTVKAKEERKHKVFEKNNVLF